MYWVHYIELSSLHWIHQIFFVNSRGRFTHSHKKRKDGLKTRAVLIEISVICWNWPSGPKRRGLLQKYMAFSEGTSYLQVIFVLIWIKQTLIWFILKEMEVEMDCLTSRILLQKACNYKCQFCTKVCASSRLISQIYMVTGQRKCNGMVVQRIHQNSKK